MMSYINKYLRNFKPYAVASHKVWQVKEEERNTILKLDWNESTIQPSPKVKERINKLMETNFLNLYPEIYNAELHDLLAEYVGLPKQNIQYFASSDSLHEYISHMYITVGDPVLILWPSYDNFRLTAEVAGARVMFYELEDDFSLNKKEFEEIIQSKDSSLVYICNPNNPTGLLLSKNYIEHLLMKFPNTMFLVDEAYIEFSKQETCKDLVCKYDNILISRTMSKAFGLANIRFGYLLASEENIGYISSIRNPKNITTFAQQGVIGALLDVEYMEKYVLEVNKAKRYFIDEVNKNCSDKLYAYESSANFVLVKCANIDIKKKLLDYLEQNNVFVRNVMHCKKIEDCIRITIGTNEQMKKVVNLLIEFKAF